MLPFNDGDAVVTLLIVQTGTTVPDVRKRRGDLGDWFITGCGLLPENVTVVRADLDEPLPEPKRYSGVIVTGSAAMVSQREPWSERTAQWLAKLVTTDATALLGSCYGHQLIAHGLDGHVGLNPNGREIGTISVELTADGSQDPLLSVLPRHFTMQASHSETVLRLPSGARLLAHNTNDAHQAFAIGTRAWGIQFHPEFDADIVRGYITARHGAILDEGLNPDDLRNATSDAPHGTALLRRFIELLDD